MVKNVAEINKAKQDFLPSLSDAEELSNQLSTLSKECAEIEDKIKKIEKRG